MDKYDLLYYLIIGFISVVIGMVAINVVLDKEQRDKYNTVRTYLQFFLIGIMIHIFVQMVNLDKIYCNKQCRIKLGLKVDN
jgi:hypothetical protein